MVTCKEEKHKKARSGEEGRAQLVWSGVGGGQRESSTPDK